LSRARQEIRENVCVECNRTSSFWLCSNLCARAYAQKRGRCDCAVCSYDKKTGRIGRQDTTQLCAECRRRAENCDWVHRECEEPDELIDRRDAENLRLREQQDQPLLEITPLVTEIVRLIVEGEHIAYVYRDRHGHRHNRFRCRAYTIRRLAQQVGCSRMLVQRVVQSIEK
jgi:hypothetical protein